MISSALYEGRFSPLALYILVFFGLVFIEFDVITKSDIINYNPNFNIKS